MKRDWMVAAGQEPGPGWKVTIAVAGIAAVASIVAALIASRSARSVKKAELDAQRIRDLEASISEKKYETYKPMINLLKDMLDRREIGEDVFRASVSEFATWVTIYGSDEAVGAFRNFMQAAYASPPPVVLMRLYADFVIAARRDIGYPDTRVTRQQFLGMRINDIYAHRIFSDIDKPFADLCRDANWSPPWLQRPNA
ncbi:hypothetical protein [Streptomyces luridiscabiei]|uniref:hypothetical protein n=1 Tax=Streptomyces luridiscabiei TaxID=164114 RepID=UPI00131AFFAB|nr:hypothetical protein [Streptomyces luridiscabiei]